MTSLYPSAIINVTTMAFRAGFRYFRGLGGNYIMWHILRLPGGMSAPELPWITIYLLLCNYHRHFNVI